MILKGYSFGKGTTERPAYHYYILVMSLYSTMKTAKAVPCLLQVNLYVYQFSWKNINGPFKMGLYFRNLVRSASKQYLQTLLWRPITTLDFQNRVISSFLVHFVSNFIENLVFRVIRVSCESERIICPGKNRQDTEIFTFYDRIMSLRLLWKDKSIFIIGNNKTL